MAKLDLLQVDYNTLSRKVVRTLRHPLLFLQEWLEVITYIHSQL